MLDWIKSVLWYTQEERQVLSQEQDSPLIQRHSRMLDIEKGVRIVDVPNPGVQPDLPVVLLVHGLGGQAGQFEHLIDYLAYFCAVVAVDFPGNGKSPPPASWEAVTPDNLVRILERVIESVAPAQDIVVIGHSLGSHTALRLSARLGNRCRGVVCITPPAYKQPPVGYITQLVLRNLPPVLFDIFFRAQDRLGGPESLSVRRMVWDGTHDPEILVRQWHTNLQSKSDCVLAVLGRFRHLTEAEAKTFTVPTLVVAAEYDHVCPPQMSQLLVTWLPNATLKTVRNSGHAVLIEQPELLQATIADFLVKKIDKHMSLAHHLKLRDSKGDKWSLKNEQKWKATLPVGDAVAGLRGLKTLRQDDEVHGPRALEATYPGIAHLIDISRDLPPYDPLTLTRIKYHKFPTVSKIPPSREQTSKFIALVKELVKDGEVGVHCHYGFNRTGFLICSFLIEAQKFSVREALDSFSAARPPGIRHPHFIDELFVRYS